MKKYKIKNKAKTILSNDANIRKYNGVLLSPNALITLAKRL